MRSSALTRLLLAHMIGIIFVGCDKSKNRDGNPRPTIGAAQKEIRARLLAEGGDERLIYAGVDFDGCGLTIRSRAPRIPGTDDTRQARSFHAASLEPITVPSANQAAVTLSITDNAKSIRVITETFTAKGLHEAVSFESGLTLPFQNHQAAVAVARALNNMAALCQCMSQLRSECDDLTDSARLTVDTQPAN